MSAAIGAIDWEREPDILPSRDRWEATRRAFARAAALALHVLLLLGVSLTPVVRAPPKEPPTIPVELVMAPPPPVLKRAQHPPPPPTHAQPVEQPQLRAPPSAQPDIPHLESGGSPALKTGAPEKTEPKPAQEQPAQVPPAAAAPAETPAAAAEAKPSAEPAPALPLVTAPLPVAPPAEATATTKPPPPKAAKEAAQRPSTSPAAATAKAPAAPPQVASLPPTTAQPKPPTQAPPGPITTDISAPNWSEGERRGEGGGDRYLNALRDAIESNFRYPDAAHGKDGIVKYEIVMARNGTMLHVEIVQSSGLPALDRAGQDAIENSMPFQPLPIRIQGNRAFILATLHIGPHGTLSP